MPFIYSTLANPQEYTLWNSRNSSGGARTAKASVIINGGAGVAQRRLVLLGEGSAHPGVRTEVTDEQLELLKENASFKRHLEGGFLVISTAKAKVEKVAADMKEDNGDGVNTHGSAPLTEKDAKAGGRLSGPKIKVGKAE